jgi:uncharacterized protein (UPF0332 family)
VSRQLARAWKAASVEQGSAAGLLRTHRLFRASVSRAYYSAYSAVTAALMEDGVSTFGRFKNPDHGNLPALVMNHLSALDMADRRSVAQAIRRLRTRREDADYRPGVRIDESSIRTAIKDMSEVFRVLGASP